MTKCRFSELDRRCFLKGAGGAAAAAAFASALQPFQPALASSPSFSFGDMEISVFSDGTLSLPMNFMLPEQTPEEIGALFQGHGLATDMLRPDCNVTLMRSGDRLVLFDVGAGNNFQSSAGQLLSRLEDAGIDPSEITDVIFTHAHPDHLWGVLDEFDDPLFSEAQYWLPEAEWNFWMGEDTLTNMPDDRKTFVVGAQSRLEVIGEQISMIKPGMEVLPGVEALDTSGHTPGHTSYMLHAGGESLLILGDAISNSVISFEQPDWASGSDQDREKGAKTRMTLLDRLATDKSRIIGYHLPHPGLGMAERHNGAYRFIAS